MLLVEEYPIEQEEQFNTVQSFIRVKLGNIKEVICNGRRAMGILQFDFLGGFYQSVLLWFPFYFIYIGYGEYSNSLSILCPLVSCIGTIILQYLLHFCRSINHWIMSVSLMAGILVHYWIIQIAGMEKSSQTVLLLFISIFISCLVIVLPSNHIFGFQLNFLGSESRTILLNVYTASYLVRCSIAMIELVLIGHFMEDYKLSFMWILFISTIMITLIDLMRNLFLERRAIYMQEESDDSL